MNYMMKTILNLKTEFKKKTEIENSSLKWKKKLNNISREIIGKPQQQNRSTRKQNIRTPR